MSQTSVERILLDTIQLDGPADFTSVEVRRITIPADLHLGAHWHNGPVFGVIESGSAYFQVGDGAQAVLRAGDTFYEPGNQTITRFDATNEGVRFLAWFPAPSGVSPELTMGAVRPRGDA